MQGYNRKQRSAIIIIGVGETENEVDVENIAKGDMVFMGAIAKPVQDGLARISVKRNGDIIVHPADVSWFDGKLGSFEQRATQIEDNGGSTLSVRVQLQDAVVDKELQVEVIFQTLTRKVC